jgi:two-component system, NtrC family, response regulator AtoC
MMDVLGKYHWPGNVRELENLIKRYVILGNEEVISTDLAPRNPDFFSAEIPVDGQISLKKLTRQAVRELERKIILKVLQNHHWNRKQAARTLSISYRALLYKIRDAGLPSNRAAKRRGAESVKAEPVKDEAKVEVAAD